MYNYSRDHIEQIARLGARTISETTSTRRVRVLDSFDMFVLKDDISLTPHLTNDGFWEAWITSWLTRWLRPGMTFIDIGANSGYYSLLAKTLVGKYGTVVAYEPNPTYAELIRSSRSINDLDIKVREVAVADQVGLATLTVPENYHGSASITSDFEEFELTRVFEVNTTTLDAEVQQLNFFRHDIVKIDAEGAEELIWNGGKSLWSSEDHATLLLEYTPGAYSDGFLKELFDWGHVYAVTYEGGEQRVSVDWIKALTDWRMLVIRKR